MAFLEQLCSATILGPKWSNIKFVNLLGSDVTKLGKIRIVRMRMRIKAFILSVGM